MEASLSIKSDTKLKFIFDGPCSILGGYMPLYGGFLFHREHAFVALLRNGEGAMCKAFFRQETLVLRPRVCYTGDDGPARASCRRITAVEQRGTHGVS